MQSSVNRPPVRVLIVNDSAVERELLFEVLSSDPQIAVISMVNDGLQAVEAACRDRPDVVAMDLHMPHLDGMEATRRIMERCPTPIVMVSESAIAAGTPYLPLETRTFHALEYGALAIVRTPPGPADPGHASAAKELVQTLKLMAEVKVVGRRVQRTESQVQAPSLPPSATPFQLIAVGASAGGPLAVQELLASLPKDFSLPLLLVQHMAVGFIEAFASWLRSSTGFCVRQPKHGEPLSPGCLFVAPSDVHMGVTGEGRIELSYAPPEEGLRPAVSYMFRSVRRAYGSRTIAVLLSGMGRDGADEMLALKRAGAVTIAQDEASALIYGMPGEAAKLGAANYILSPQGIAKALSHLVSTGKVES